MKANRGGVLAGEAIVGRDQELGAIVNRLQTQSVLLVAERRFGKTSMLRKLSEHPPDGWLVLLGFLESKSHPLECVQTIYDVVSKPQSRKGSKLILKKGYDFLKLKNVQLTSLETFWIEALATLMSDLEENNDQRIIICLDEFPLMVWNIIKNHGANLAMSFLNGFREIRQSFEASKIRFVFNGSVGLHLIIKHLKEEHGYRGAPVNDMYSATLEGMQRGDVATLCSRLLTDESIVMNDEVSFIDRMLEKTDGLPGYIQHLCGMFQDNGIKKVKAEDIDGGVERLLNDPSMDWLEMAVDRIRIYYGNRGEIAREILAFVCNREDVTPEPEIINAVKSAMTATSHQVNEVLRDLRKDHYLVVQHDGKTRSYRFKYYLLRRWWQLSVG